MIQRLLSAIGERWPRGFYLPLLESILGVLSAASPGTILNKAIKKAVGSDHTPAWVSELYCVAWLIVEAALLALSSVPWPRALAIACSIVLSLRLLDIVTFALHWVFVARGKLESYRRSLFSFLLNLVEVAVVAAALFRIARCTPGATTPWTALYAQLADLFSITLAREAQGGRFCSVVAHVELITAWILLLIVVTVVVSGITRGELNQDSGNRAG
jgi:hypothetical protein